MKNFKSNKKKTLRIIELTILVISVLVASAFFIKKSFDTRSSADMKNSDIKNLNIIVSQNTVQQGGEYLVLAKEPYSGKVQYKMDTGATGTWNVEFVNHIARVKLPDNIKAGTYTAQFRPITSTGEWSNPITIKVVPKDQDKKDFKMYINKSDILIGDSHVMTADGATVNGKIDMAGMICPNGVNNYCNTFNGKTSQSFTNSQVKSLVDKGSPTGYYEIYFNPDINQNYSWSNMVVINVEIPSDQVVTNPESWLNFKPNNEWIYSGYNIYPKKEKTPARSKKETFKTKIFIGKETNICGKVLTPITFVKTNPYGYWGPRDFTNYERMSYGVSNFIWYVNLNDPDWIHAEWHAEIPMIDSQRNMIDNVYNGNTDLDLLTNDTVLSSANNILYKYTSANLDLFGEAYKIMPKNSFPINQQVSSGNMASQDSPNLKAPISSYFDSDCTLPTVKEASSGWFVKYQFVKRSEIAAKNSPVLKNYNGELLKVTFYEVLGYKNEDAGKDIFSSEYNKTVVREDWYFAQNVGIVQIDQMIFNEPGHPKCYESIDCKSDIMADPYMSMTLDEYKGPSIIN